MGKGPFLGTGKPSAGGADFSFSRSDMHEFSLSSGTFLGAAAMFTRFPLRVQWRSQLRALSFLHCPFPLARFVLGSVTQQPWVRNSQGFKAQNEVTEAEQAWKEGNRAWLHWGPGLLHSGMPLRLRTGVVVSGPPYRCTRVCFETLPTHLNELGPANELGS